MSESDDAGERAAVVGRWLELTRTVLPGMAARASAAGASAAGASAAGTSAARASAAGARWPIALDHCFMRVFLDHAMGGQWDLRVGRPAIRTMAIEDLRRAVALAELVVADPERLEGLNAASLAWRRVQRRVRARAAGSGAGTRGGA